MPVTEQADSRGSLWSYDDPMGGLGETMGVAPASVSLSPVTSHTTTATATRTSNAAS